MRLIGGGAGEVVEGLANSSLREMWEAKGRAEEGRSPEAIRAKGDARGRGVGGEEGEVPAEVEARRPKERPALGGEKAPPPFVAKDERVEGIVGRLMGWEIPRACAEGDDEGRRGSDVVGASGDGMSTLL